VTEMELYWLAGLLEGEGSFMLPPPSDPGRPRMSLQMTDEDVVAKVAALWGVKFMQFTRNDGAGRDWKPTYSILLRGTPAVELMTRLRPLMGQRRQAQIDRALASHALKVRYDGCGPKLNAEQVRSIRAELATGGRGTAARLAREYGVSHPTIRQIRDGRIWKEA
jgi:hypothetical protein